MKKTLIIIFILSVILGMAISHFIHSIYYENLSDTVVIINNCISDKIEDYSFMVMLASTLTIGILPMIGMPRD